MEHEQGEVVNNRIYVGGLRDCIGERDLFHFFSKFGSVQHVGISTMGGYTKGYGLVTFHNIEVVGTILSNPDRDNLVLKGRKLFVGAARQRSSQMANWGGRGQVHDLHGGDEHGGQGGSNVGKEVEVDEKEVADSFPPPMGSQPNNTEAIDMEVMFINGKEFEVKRNQPSRVVLNSYVQQFKLEKPIFEMRVLNENNTPFRVFIVTMRLEGKEVVACGQSMKIAESAAAWKFCNNISHSGGSSLHYGKLVSASKVHKNKPTPSKKKKDAAKWEKLMCAKEEAANTNAAVNYVQEAAADMVVEEGNVNEEPVFVTVDQERAAGPVDSEMIQLAYNAGSKSGCSYILPSG